MSGESIAWLPDAASLYLAECWLRTRPAGESAVLLAPPAIREPALNLAARYGTVHEVVAVAPEDALPDAVAAEIAGAPRPRVTVPRALDMVPMRYQPALIPDLAPHYPLLRTLWRWGFREVCFEGHHGGHTFAIPYLLDAFQDRHRGRRCFVVGNGPSLNAINMGKLKDEITLGSNRCFLGYEKWGFPFTYWGVYDNYQIETYHREYEDGVPPETVKFFPAEYLPVLHAANGCPVNCVWPARAPRAFSAGPEETYVGFTVTYMLLQVAACMGCDPIILIGADHRYTLSRRGYTRAFRSARRALARRLRGGRIYDAAAAAHRAWRKSAGEAPGAPALWSTQDAAGPTHFTAAYTAGGQNRFLPPEPEEAERDFDCAHAWAKSNGRQILNATPGTALESFPKVDFESLF